jgi:tetratricopeptide (TPR) repeat protein
LALFGKTTACTLPVAMFLILWLKQVPISPKRLLQLVPFFVMAVGMGLLVMWWEKHLQGTEQINLGLNLPARFLIAGRALWFYLFKLFWPVNLTFSYPRWNINPVAIRQYLWPAASTLMIASAWFWRKRLGRAPLIAILFFAVTLLPMLGFFSLFTFMYTFVADHYQYAACIGPIALVAAGGAILMRRLPAKIKIVVPLLAGILLFILGFLTFRQSRIYIDKMSLWQDTVNKNPDSWLAHSQLVKLFFGQGNIIDAKPHLERALELAPYVKKMDSRIYASFHHGMGLIYEKENRLSDAAGEYQKALDITDYFEVVMNANYCLGRVLTRQGKIEAAREHFLRARDIANAHNNYRVVEDSYNGLRLLNEYEKSRNSVK